MAADAPSGSQRFLTMTLGNELFAIDIFSVREILDYTDITRIPQTRIHARRGQRARQRRPGHRPADEIRPGTGGAYPQYPHRHCRDQKGRCHLGHGGPGRLVKEVLELETDRIDPPPRMGAAVRADFIRGIGKHGDRFCWCSTWTRSFRARKSRICPNLPTTASRRRPNRRRRPRRKISSDSPAQPRTDNQPPHGKNICNTTNALMPWRKSCRPNSEPGSRSC